MMKALLGLGLTLLVAQTATAQIALNPNNQFTVDWNNRLGSDWPYLARYRADNARLVPTPGHPRIVFMGDSITENWVKLSGDFFTPSCTITVTILSGTQCALEPELSEPQVEPTLPCTSPRCIAMSTAPSPA